jgi:hypothetical protein
MPSVIPLVIKDVSYYSFTVVDLSFGPRIPLTGTLKLSEFLITVT